MNDLITKARIDASNRQMLDMATVLFDWMHDRLGYSAKSIYFLCSVLSTMVYEGWPDEQRRPMVYTELLRTIDQVGAELGPLIVAVEADGDHDIEPSADEFSTRH